MPEQPPLPPPAYRCNCGQEFPHPGARIVHMVTCPVMVATRPPDDPAQQGTPDLAASAPDRAADVAGTTPEQPGTRSPV